MDKLLILNTVMTLVNLIIIYIVIKSTYVCPITNKRDFKCNMYKHYFCSHPEMAHVTWYSKQGYEKRFDCKIISADIQKENWTTISNKKKGK